MSDAPVCNRCGTTIPYDISVGWIDHSGARFCGWSCVDTEADGPRAAVCLNLVPVELLEARVEEYRLEIAKKDMQIVRYRNALVENGVEPPDMDGAELLAMWRDCRHVMSTASEFVMRLGTGKELLVDWSHK